jgi:hypothetical protein
MISYDTYIAGSKIIKYDNLDFNQSFYDTKDINTRGFVYIRIFFIKNITGWYGSYIIRKYICKRF